MPSSDRKSVGNGLIDALSSESYKRLVRNLEPIDFSLGQTVYESGAQMTSVFFPTTSHVSLLYVTAKGGSVEMGLVGNEGVVGISLFMGGDSTPNRATVQGGGQALKLQAAPMQSEFKRGSDFQYLMLRYTQALMTQISQTAVCNRLHSVEHRLCRWLLMNVERAPSDKLQMTHDLISSRLGVRREGITTAAQALQRKGLISYVRGQIKIIDRRGLEECSCECYAVVKAEHDRLLVASGPTPRIQKTPLGRARNLRL